MSADRHNIVLTGFMGTGKTAVGKALAARSGRTFVDLDAEIFAQHGAVSDIFAEEDEEAFREYERTVVAEVAPRRNLVVATGGGTFLDEENVVAFLGSEIIALSATPDEIIERVTADGIETRPLLAHADDPRAEVERLFEERRETYERFTTIDTTGKSVDRIVEEIGSRGTDISSPLEEPSTSGRASRETLLYGIVTVMTIIAILLLIAVLTF